MALSFQLPAKDALKEEKTEDKLHDSLVLNDEFSAAFQLKRFDSLGMARSRRAEICMQRAEALVSSCRFSEAYGTLKPFGYFSLPEDLRSRLCISRLKACFLAGDMEVFGSEIQEALSAGLLPTEMAYGIEDYLKRKKPRHRSEELASALSSIPGLGKYYAGDWVGGIGDNLSATTVIGGGLYTAFSMNLPITGLSIFGTLYYSLLNNSMETSGQSAREANSASLLDYYTPVFHMLF